MNIWYVLAKKDKRYKYDFLPIFHRSHVFKSLSEAKKVKHSLKNNNIVILKRTCQVLNG